MIILVVEGTVVLLTCYFKQGIMSVAVSDVIMARLNEGRLHLPNWATAIASESSTPYFTDFAIGKVRYLGRVQRLKVTTVTYRQNSQTG